MTAVPARLRAWIDRQMGVSARFSAVILLLLAALAVQAAVSLNLVGSLHATTDRLAHDGLATIGRARVIQAAALQQRQLVERTAELARAEDVARRAAAHRDGIARLRDLLAQEIAAAPAAPLAAALRRAAHDLAEFELTGAAVLARLAADLPGPAGRSGPAAQEPPTLRRAAQVFGVAADRLEHDVAAWRQAHWRATLATADALFDRVDAAASRAAIAGGATAILGLVALLVLWRLLARLGGITRAVLRLARHEPGAAVAIPGRDDLGPIGDIARAVAIWAEDVRELERRGIAQAQASQLLDAALNNMTQGLATTDADGRLQVCNHRFAAILALPEGMPRAGMAIGAVLALCHDGPAAAALAPPADMPGGCHQSIVALGRAQVIRAHWVRMRDGGWLGTFDDITRLQHNEARLVHLARHDALTDLPNRTALRDAVARAAARATPGRPFAVLSLNLDRFHIVNDSLGHEAGDALLRQVAERLRRQVRTGDTLARIGADSFAIIQPAASPPSGTGAFAHRLIAVLSEPYVVGRATVVVGASVGVVLHDPARDPADADALLRNADLARQQARQDGGGAVRFFAPEMDTNARERRLLELDLRRALEGGEFELHFQPLVAVRTRRICAFEALLRWHHPQRGLVRPDLFIPLAEEVGLIVPIGEWVLARACAEAARWPAEVGVAVNLSPLQFGRDGLVEQVQAALAASAIDPARLELEITERVLLRDSADTLATLHRLRALGVRISLDDFGTGYSSLGYLRSFPFDKIKIDKSFVQGLDAGQAGAGESGAIVRAIVGLGHSLGIATTAEGVETVAQLNALVAEGCTEMQGFLFSPPRPAGEVARLLAVGAAWPERVAAG